MKKMSKRGRRFERRLAERKERAAMKKFINARDFKRWYQTLFSVMPELTYGGK
ncbi:hypothetical protein [Selenomonas bovis]|uniref:hypothetical protein n=1 Tax=Selenomonas bovis TaxID=416586 RepID=UPI003AB9B8D3